MTPCAVPLQTTAFHGSQIMGIEPAARARVLYDGDCAFCCKSVELLRRLDWLGKLDFVNVRDASLPVLKEPLVASAPLLEQMHVLTRDGRHLYGGYRAVRWLAWRLPLTWLIAPLLYLPGMTYLGQKFYLWIARNRFKIVPCTHGVCSLPHRDAQSSTAPQ
jgi:predicted DCC family thiol-disulfide oxidoreductase YuxK